MIRSAPTLRSVNSDATIPELADDSNANLRGSPFIVMRISCGPGARSFSSMPVALVVPAGLPSTVAGMPTALL